MEALHSPAESALAALFPARQASRLGFALKLLSRGLMQCWHTAWHSVRPLYGIGAWGLAMLRPLNAFRCIRLTVRLFNTDTYRRHAETVLVDSLLHFVRTRHYLRTGLTPSQRAQFALDHVSIQEQTFSIRYFEAIYEKHGLVLWRHEFASDIVHIELALADRAVPEGDLRLTLMVNDQPLHHVGFSLLRFAEASPRGAATPFVARNQGRGPEGERIMEVFERAFPQNSPAYFTYAALQGMAGALKSSCIRTVRAAEQMVFKTENPKHSAKHFLNAYDMFWQKLGAVDDGGLGYAIPIPFHVTPLEEISSKHRKRALQRRANWLAVEAAARATIADYLRTDAEASD